MDAVVLARGWGCCSQGRSHADRPLSFRRDREDCRRSLFCLIRFSTRTVAVFLFLARDTPFRSRLGFMAADSANRSVSEHSDADDVTRIPSLYANASGLEMEFELDSESVHGCLSPVVRSLQ